MKSRDPCGWSYFSPSSTVPGAVTSEGVDSFRAPLSLSPKHQRVRVAGRLFREKQVNCVFGSVRGVSHDFPERYSIACRGTRSSWHRIEAIINPHSPIESVFSIAAVKALAVDSRRRTHMKPFTEGTPGQAPAAASTSRGKNYALWTMQVLLALLFMFSGVMKFLMPAAKMQEGPVKLPIPFIHFIGIAEILGGLGLILPGMLRIKRSLTPLAASGLVIIMIGATVVTAMGGVNPVVLFPFVIGVLVAVVAYGRREWMAG